MTEEKLNAIAAQSCRNLTALMSEMREEIEAAIMAATEQAEDDGKDSLAITLSHAIKLDLAKDMQSDSLAVSLRRKASIEERIPDPSQPDLPLEQ